MAHFEKAIEMIKARQLEPIKYENIELFNGFSYETSEKLASEYREWLEGLDMKNTYAGANGGRLTFELTPTSIGMVCVVKDAITKTEFNLTDYGSW